MDGYCAAGLRMVVARQYKHLRFCVPHCAINCTAAVYSNVSCPDCSSNCNALNCPVDCTINDGIECAWSCEPMQNCTVPLPVLTCTPYYCESSGFAMQIHALLIALLFS